MVDYALIILRMSFIPLVIIGLGLVFNTICFLIFRFTPEFRKMSSMVFLSFVCVCDTLSLFNWNIKHYTKPNFGFEIEYVNLFTCKVFTFGQYYLLQASGFLLCFVSIDRFITIRTTPGSFFSKLPFGSVKSAYAWAAGIMTVLFILNSHILILNGYYRDPVNRNRTVTGPNGTYIETYPYVNPKPICYRYRSGFRVYPTWDKVHMFFYSFIPGTIMAVFNILLIYTTLRPNKQAMSSADVKAAKKKRNLTVSLLVVTSAFIVLTFPSTIAYGYFSDYLYTVPYGRFLLELFDYFSFFNHVCMFFFTFITHQKFRNIVLFYASRMLCFKSETVARLKTYVDGNHVIQSRSTLKTQSRI